MNTADIKEYWPKASIAQVRAIQVYHDAGWQINPQEDDGMIPCHRPDTMETVEHSLITSDGRMIPWPNDPSAQALQSLPPNTKL
jgi:hypothetical protein